MLNLCFGLHRSQRPDAPDKRVTGSLPTREELEALVGGEQRRSHYTLPWSQMRPSAPGPGQCKDSARSGRNLAPGDQSRKLVGRLLVCFSVVL